MSMPTQSEQDATDTNNERVAAAARQYVVRKRRLTIGTLVSIVAIIGPCAVVGRWVLTPWFVSVASDALGSEIDIRIDGRTQPIKNGVKALLQSKIDELVGERDLLLARRARDPSKWTDLDQMKLTQTERQLDTARRALAQFETAPLAATK
jgi:hypothetical protein